MADGGALSTGCDAGTHEPRPVGGAHGEILDNGWTIKDIADGRILLAKDGETLALVVRQ